MSVPVLDRFSLAGKVALVTGASSDLSAGFAVALAQAGAEVVLAARRQAGLEAASRSAVSAGWANSTNWTPWSSSWPARPPPKSPVPRWPSSATCPALSGEKSP